MDTGFEKGPTTTAVVDFLMGSRTPTCTKKRESGRQNSWAQGEGSLQQSLVPPAWCRMKGGAGFGCDGDSRGAVRALRLPRVPT